jgi:hypothetical protein
MKEGESGFTSGQAGEAGAFREQKIRREGDKSKTANHEEHEEEKQGQDSTFNTRHVTNWN